MSFAIGFSALEAAGLATLQSIVTKSPIRSIVWNATDAMSAGSLYPQVVVEERHRDAMIITQHPVEQGAAISDHAYKQPAEVQVRAGWSLGGSAPSGGGLPELPLSVISSIIPQSTPSDYLAKIYATFLNLQATRALATLVTGKRTYPNMLIEEIEVETDHKTETTLLIKAWFKEVLIVQTQVLIVPPADVHAQPKKTAPIINVGQVQALPGTNYNAGGVT